MKGKDKISETVERKFINYAREDIRMIKLKRNWNRNEIHAVWYPTIDARCKWFSQLTKGTKGSGRVRIRDRFAAIFGTPLQRRSLVVDATTASPDKTTRILPKFRPSGEISCLDFPARKCSDDYVYHERPTEREKEREIVIRVVSHGNWRRLGHRRWTHVERANAFEFPNNCFGARRSRSWLRMRPGDRPRLLVKQIRITCSIMVVLVATCIKHPPKAITLRYPRLAYSSRLRELTRL